MSTRQIKTILLTGANGFLGNIIRETLVQQGYSVNTLGRSKTSDYCFDLSKQVPVFKDKFDLVVHNAGKAHVVPRSKAEADQFIEVNVRGTENLLYGLEAMLPDSIVFISSIAVYGLTSGTDITEETPLLAVDPYGKSKIEAERLVEKWGQSNGVKYASLRLPLVAGKNPPGNLGAMISGIERGRYFQIGKSKARKSIVMAQDVGRILPIVAQKGGTFNLTDGYHPTFSELEETITRQIQREMPFNLPSFVAWALGFTGDLIDYIFPGKSPITSDRVKKIISTLTFDDSKARRELSWKPNRVIDVFRVR